MKKEQPILGGFATTSTEAANYIAVMAVMDKLKDLTLPEIRDIIQSIGLVDIAGSIESEVVYAVINFVEVLSLMKELPTCSIKGTMDILSPNYKTKA